jgi:stearoyl-CoA desaturase (delta-9 desaturase)
LKDWGRGFTVIFAMMYLLLCFLVFVSTYTLNLLYISVFYHRGLTHRAVNLRPWVRQMVVWTGNWVSGLDPKGWVCMHRLHHQYSDTPKDPHSPHYQGVFKLALGQLHSYNRVLIGLIREDPKFMSVVPDLDFKVSWLNRKRLWALPYIVQALVAVAIGYFGHAWLLGYCYWIGMMSHPIQGWMVNSLAHKYGYRNFATDDRSRNNTLVAWLVMGEGFQNNHHHSPSSARFSVKWWEIDTGYYLCCVAKWFGLLKLNSQPSVA